ncbi:MAG TPA: peptidoglycan-binding protein [Chthoniobacterales bacterium]|jgi:peptidoglycan hydrolase-like protein with peptidoglycan-binding domain
MNRRWLIAAFFALATLSPAGADQLIESAQQKLKDEGFYYGEINGNKDADTTAAIRRYQIRNGLPVTGELDAETERSLKSSSSASPTPAARPAETRALEKSEAAQEPVRPSATIVPREFEETDGEPVYEPRSRALRSETRGLFDGTPFEIAPPDVQRDVIIGAQTILARGGYYRSEIDGIYGPEMEFALRAYQSRLGMPPNGRLDMETLSSLGLLPGQQIRGGVRPHRRIFPPPSEIGPAGERVYIPN